MNVILHDFGDLDKRPSGRQSAVASFVFGFVIFLFTYALVGAFDEWGHWNTPQQQTEGRR